MGAMLGSGSCGSIAGMSAADLGSELAVVDERDEFGAGDGWGGGDG